MFELDPEPAGEVALGAKLVVVVTLEGLPFVLVPLAVAPVAAIRELRSACVVQVMLVPAELIRGSAAHIKPDPHEVRTYCPLTHWANSPLTQAFPEVHGEDVVNDWNWLFKLIASIPFCSTKLPPRRLRLGRAVAKEESTRVAKTEIFMVA